MTDGTVKIAYVMFLRSRTAAGSLDRALHVAGSGDPATTMRPTTLEAPFSDATY